MSHNSWFNDDFHTQGEQSSGQTPQHFSAHKQQAPRTQNRASSRPLYFLVFSASLLMLSIIAFFFVHIFHMGRNVTGGESAPAPASSSKNATTPAQQPSTTATPLTALAEKTQCTASQDFRTFTSHVHSDSTDGDASSVPAVLSVLSEKCGAEYTQELTKHLETSSSDILTKFANTSWWHYASPVPSGAIEATEFTTTQNNIRCTINQDAVNCSIYVYDYPSPEGCEGKTATYHVGAAGDTTADCLTQVNTANVVPYGSVVANGNFWCTVNQTEGVTCTSALSGHGFQLRRATDRIF